MPALWRTSVADCAGEEGGNDPGPTLGPAFATSVSLARSAEGCESFAAEYCRGGIRVQRRGRRHGLAGVSGLNGVNPVRGAGRIGPSTGANWPARSTAARRPSSSIPRTILPARSSRAPSSTSCPEFYRDLADHYRRRRDFLIGGLESREAGASGTIRNLRVTWSPRSRWRRSRGRPFTGADTVRPRPGRINCASTFAIKRKPWPWR